MNETRVRKALALFVAALLVAGASGEALAKKKKSKKHKPAATQTDQSDESGSEATPEPSSGASEGAGAAAKAPPEEAPKPEGGGQGEEGEGGGKRAPAAPLAPESERSVSGAPPAMWFGVGGAALFRSFIWNDDKSGGLPAYHLSPGPEVGGWLEVYPAAFATSSFAANIGLFGRFNYGIGVKSTTPPPNSTTLTTKFQDYMAGLKVRLPLGTFVPDLSVAYGAQSFKLSGGTASDLPSVDYKFIRPALGTRIQLAPVADIDLSVGYLAVTDSGKAAGEIQTAFPNMKAYAIDVAGSFGYRFTNLIGARLGVEFRQYGLDFNVKAGDPLLVGGAVDRYITVWGGVELTLDGVGGGAAAAASEAEPVDKPMPRKAKKKAPAADGDGDNDSKPAKSGGDDF